MAGLLQCEGDYSAAQAYYQQSLEIRKESYKAQPPIVAKSLSNLGALYRDIGDYSSARNCFDQALAIRKQALGLKHPATIGTLYNLGNLLTRTKDYEQARLFGAIARTSQGSSWPPTSSDGSFVGRLRFFVLPNGRFHPSPPVR